MREARWHSGRTRQATRFLGVVVHLRQKVIRNMVGFHGDAGDSVPEERIEENGGHRQSNPEQGHYQSVGNTVGESRGVRRRAAAQFDERENHTKHRSDQPEHWPQRSNYGGVVVLLFFVALDAFESIFRHVAGIFQAVLQSAHPGGQHSVSESNYRPWPYQKPA